MFMSVLLLYQLALTKSPNENLQFPLQFNGSLDRCISRKINVVFVWSTVSFRNVDSEYNYIQYDSESMYLVIIEHKYIVHTSYVNLMLCTATIYLIEESMQLEKIYVQPENKFWKLFSIKSNQPIHIFDIKQTSC